MNIAEYNTCVEKYLKMVYRISFHYFGNREDAEDVSRDVFIKLYSSRISMENDEEKSVGLNVLFSLPLDESMSDHGEANRVLNQILNSVEEKESNVVSKDDVDFSLSTPGDLAEWDKWLEMGMPGNDVKRRCHLLEGSETRVEADEDGSITFAIYTPNSED